MTRADKKLVLLCQHFYPEMVSTGMHMTELATRLAELGWQITVLTSKPSWGTDDPDAGPVPAEMEYQNVRIVRVPTLGSQSGGLLSKTVSALTFVPSVGVGAVAETSRVPQPRDHDEPPFRWGVGVGRLPGVPASVSRHRLRRVPGVRDQLGCRVRAFVARELWRRTTRLILCGAAATVVIGRDMRALIEAKMPARLHHRIVMIPNWSDERHVRPVPPSANSLPAGTRRRGELRRPVRGAAGRQAQPRTLDRRCAAPAGYERGLPVRRRRRQEDQARSARR